MSAPSDCPEMECLQALLSAALPPDQRESCERHLESCPACQERLDGTVAGADALLRLARNVGDPTAVPADAVLSQIIERLHETRSPMRAAGEEPADLHFLRPADHPGVLGLLGEYEVSEVIGVGGMGIVLKAWDPALHRLVAIKVMAAALAGSATARRRFTREAQAAAAVSHDHVVAVHAVFEANCLPYLVMQYVAGESLQARLDRAGALEVVEAVRIALQTASGLAAAHAQGLIHRDIKPANLLLENGLARVKITDFGLARTADDVRLTRCGEVAGTPEYMAPEQARGDPVDHRADLFSLGSVLYAMCTGVPPFRGSTALAVLRRVNDEDPAPIRSLNRDAPAWLEAIVARLIAKDPAERFQSAAELVVLLEGCLAHLREPATTPLPGLPPAPGGRTKPSQNTLRVRIILYFRRPLFLAAAALLVALGLSGLFLLQGVGPSKRARGDARPALNQLLNHNGLPVGRLHGHTGPVHNVLFTPDGRIISASGWPMGDYSIRIWDPVTCQELNRISTPGQVQALALSTDGRFVLAGLSNGTVLHIDLSSTQIVRSLRGHGQVVSWVGFARDGQHAFSTSFDGTARMWDLRDGQEVQRFQSPNKQPIHACAVSPDGGRLLTGDTEGVLRLWNVATGEEVKKIELNRGWIYSAVFTPDGRQAVVGDMDVGRYDLETGEELRVYPGPTPNCSEQVILSPDGRRLLTAGWDGGVRLYDVATGQLIRLLGSHDEFVFSVAFSPDGRQAASAGGGRRLAEDFEAGTDFDIRIWDVPDPPIQPVAAP